MRNEIFVSVDPLAAYELFGTVLGNCSLMRRDLEVESPREILHISFLRPDWVLEAF